MERYKRRFSNRIQIYSTVDYLKLTKVDKMENIIEDLHNKKAYIFIKDGTEKTTFNLNEV